MVMSCKLLTAFTALITYFSQEAIAVDFILVVDHGFRLQNGTIYRAPMADLQQFAQIPLYGLVHPSALDYNPITESIFWTDYGNTAIPPSISRANLDGTGQTILQQGVGEAPGLAVDYIANEIYWTETNDTVVQIRKASALGASGAMTVVYENMTNPHDIAIDPIRREMYWSDWGEPDPTTLPGERPTFTATGKYPKIEKANLDGTNRRIIIDGKDHPGILEPYGLILDFENELLYFCDPANNSIYQSDLHGYGFHNLVEIVSPEIKPFDIAFYKDSIYWTDLDWPALIEIERFQGLYAQLVGPFIFAQARGLYINTDTDESCSPNPCQNGLCRQFVEGYQCVCQANFTGESCEITSDNSCSSNPCQNYADCNQLEEGFECLCKTGFSGMFCEQISVLIVADTAKDKIYKTTLPVKRGAKYKEIPIPDGTAAPKALDFDPVSQRVFWSDNFTIQSILLDGTDQQIVRNESQIEGVQGLALDTINRKLYWTDIGKQTIEQSDLDGSNQQVIIDNAMAGDDGNIIGRPWNIIVDPAGGFIYWTDVAKEEHLATIERAYLDGSGRVTLLPANLFEPLALQADFSVGKLFIGDAAVNRIESCDLDGRDRRVLIQLRQTDAHPFDIGLYQNILYWSDQKLNRLVALNREGSTDGALLVGPDQFTKAAGMVIYEESDGSCDPNPCKGGRCRQLIRGYQCVCDITRNIGDNCDIETDNSCAQHPCQNGARCIQKVQGFECVCLYGFSGEFCNTEDVIFIADQLNGTIYRAPLRTLTFRPILQGLQSPTALRYDLKNNQIYWTDNVTNKIERANATDGSDRSDVVSGLSNPGGLSIDRSSRHLYWSDIGDNSIYRIDMDGTNLTRELFIQDANLQRPQHIAVDWRNSQVYWTNWQDPVRIERMFTNKTGRETVINATVPSNIPVHLEDRGTWMSQPSGINIDYQDEILYWGDINLTKISTYDLNTGEQGILVDRDILTTHIDLVVPYDLVSYEEYIYWTDPYYANASLVEANRRWPIALSVGSLELQKVVGLDIYTALPDCWAKPCKNGATCYSSSSADDNSYVCVCIRGYMGVHCQTEINECLSDPCLNAGICQDKVNDYSCYCPSGYTGKNCETDINECIPSPCLNGANCTTPNVNDYECECPFNVCGKRCDVVCPPACSSGPCKNGGSCLEPVPQMWMCLCPIDYTGDTCETEIPACDSNPCQNEGTCQKRQFRTGYNCVCAPGYSGDNCEVDINNCIGNQCMFSSVCIDGINQYTCICSNGYTGQFCETNINECYSDPCEYGGTCSDQINGYLCTCLQYFDGLNCEIPTRDCEDISCQNGGQCFDRGGGFVVCVCDAPYTGVFCEIIDACSTNKGGDPCQNGGTCTTVGTNYNCQCAPGWEGQNCELATNECRPNPCENGGTCIDLENDYVCECKKDWNGPHCTDVVSMVQSCHDNPQLCLNGAKCQGGNRPGTIICLCRPGFTGVYCQVDSDECASLPCWNNGLCIDKPNGYQCQCNDPYIGDDCKQILDRGCPFPQFPSGFLYPEKVFYPRGNRVTFLCHPDKTLNGATSAVCLANGWSEDPPECIKRGASAGTAVAIGIGSAIAIFLLILIILAAILIFFHTSRKDSAADDVAIVGFSNQQSSDGTGFGEVHIGHTGNNNDTSPARVDSSTVPDNEPIIIKSDDME